MSEENKKPVSFGFSKIIKKPIFSKKEEKKVDYVDYVDKSEKKSVNIIGGEPDTDIPIVIPLLGSKTWHERILNKTDVDIYKQKAELKAQKIKDESDQNEINGDAAEEILANSVVKVEISEEQPKEVENLTLQEQAAKEILLDLNLIKKEDDKEYIVSTKINEKDIGDGKEPSLDDYEKIPLEAYGAAMLRGMGWNPKADNENDGPQIPDLRPRGMGLGADRQLVECLKQSKRKKNTDDKLILKQGSFVKILAGKRAGEYAKVEGFDDEAGRVMVKPSLSEETISVYDFTLKTVTPDEYKQNSKVLNIKSYTKDKQKELEQQKNSGEAHNKSKHRSSSSSDANSEDTGRRKRDRSEEDKRRKSKKSKHKKDRDSPEYSKKKSRDEDSSSNNTKERKRRDDSRSRKRHSSSDRSLDRHRSRSRSSSSEEERSKNKKSKHKKRDKLKRDRSRDRSEDRKHRKRERRSRSRDNEKKKKSKKSKRRDSSSERSKNRDKRR